MQLPDWLNCDRARISGLEILLILKCIFASLWQTAIKKRKCKACSSFFYQPFGYTNAKFESLTRRQPQSLIIITTLFQVRPVGSHSMTESIKWDSSRKPSDFECNVFSHCLTHPKRAPETNDHLVFSFFSRDCKPFSLNLNIFHTLSQCYYSSSKHVNVGWEVLR